MTRRFCLEKLVVLYIMHIVLSLTCTYYGIDLILRLLHLAPMTHFGGNLHPVCGRYCFSHREKVGLCIYTREVLGTKAFL